MSVNKVKNIYDVLFSFEQKKKNQLSYPIHKKLNFSSEKIQDITDWILHENLIPEHSHILDAGCGTGFGLMKFCSTQNSTGLGISVSPKEIESATKSAKQKELTAACSFEVLDFTQKFNASFDIIIAIESLKHAPDLSQALQNLSNHLNTKGHLIIIEDFYIPELAPQSLQDKFLNYWCVQELYEEKDYINILSKSNLKIKRTEDFTPLVFRKNTKVNMLKMAFLEKAKMLLKNKDKQELSRIYNGGIIMDHFYNIGAFEYKALVFSK